MKIKCMISKLVSTMRGRAARTHEHYLEKWRKDFARELCNAAFYQYPPDLVVGAIVEVLKAPGITYGSILEYVAKLQTVLFRQAGLPRLAEMSK